MKLAALALGLALCAQAPQKGASLPRAEADKLRTAFAEALAKGDEKSRAALLALGAKLEPKYAFDGLRDALRAGPKLDKRALEPRKQGKQAEELHRFDKTTVGYTFACEQGEFRYAVDLPAGYDPERPCPVLLDPGHGAGTGKSDQEKADYLPFFRGQCEAAKLGSWLVVRTEIVEQIGADGVKGKAPEERVAAAFQELWRDVASRFAIDCDRLYASGLSQTGFWTWYLGRASPDRYAGLAPMSAVTWQVDKYLDNFASLPVCILHGAKDEICKVGEARATYAALKQLGAPVKYIEIPEAAHDVAVWGKLHDALAWLAANPRAKYARKGAKAFETLADPWCGCVQVLALAAEGDGAAQTAPTATLRFELEQQTVKLSSQGVKRARLFLARELVDPGQPVEVLWNAKSVWKGNPERSFATMLEAALDRVDWTQTYESAIDLKCP